VTNPLSCWVHPREKPIRIEIRPSRRKLTESRSHTLDVLVMLRALDVAPNRTRPPLCIVPVVDVSGSMGAASYRRFAARRIFTICSSLNRLFLIASSGVAEGIVSQSCAGPKFLEQVNWLKASRCRPFDHGAPARYRRLAGTDTSGASTRRWWLGSDTERSRMGMERAGALTPSSFSGAAARDQRASLRVSA
jgi:hypothetical protein